MRKNIKSKSKSKKRSKVKHHAHLPFGPGYRGLALTICCGDTNLANKMFGI